MWKNQHILSSYQSLRKNYPGAGLSPLDEGSWSRWILEKSEGLTRMGVLRLSQSVRYYAYLVLQSQSVSRTSILGNSSIAMDGQ